MAVQALQPLDHDLEKAHNGQTAPHGLWLPRKSQVLGLYGLLRNLTRTRLRRSISKSLLPRFLRPGAISSLAVKQSNPTAYLDAVRGYAAIAVVNYHFWFDGGIFDSRLLNIIRQGPLMVDIFFVVSGIVLTRKALRDIRRGQNPLAGLTSSIFRRYPRLYLSADFAIFVCFVFIHLDVIECPHKHRLPFGEQFLDFVWDVFQFNNPFHVVRGYFHPENHTSSYNNILWTIPTELRGSIIVYLMCIVCRKMTPLLRATIIWTMIVLSFMACEIYVSLFLFGMWIAERSVVREEQYVISPQLPSVATPDGDEVNTKSNMLSLVGNHLLHGAAIVLALYLVDPPRRLLNYVPLDWDGHAHVHFWNSISAALFIFGLDGCKTYQRPFISGFSQYIGQLSFGIYAMHVPVLYFKPLADLVAYLRDDLLGNNLAYGIIRWLLTLFIVLWLADYFTRVDKRIVAFGRTLEKRFMHDTVTTEKPLS